MDSRADLAAIDWTRMVLEAKSYARVLGPLSGMITSYYLTS